MMKFYPTLFYVFFTAGAKRFLFCMLLLLFTALAKTNAQAPVVFTVHPLADAYVQNGASAGRNFGFDTTLQLKETTTAGAARQFYLKFPLTKTGNVTTAKLRLYGRNLENTSSVSVAVFGVDSEAWTESGLTWNNAPAAQSVSAGSFSVGAEGAYYELDLTALAQAQLAKTSVISLVVKDTGRQNSLLSFHSREHVLYQPELVITTAAVLPFSGARLFVENLDRFPSNEDFMASRIQVPWSRNRVVYNTNHDTLRVRLHNKGMNPLRVSRIALSNKANWTIQTLNGHAYDSATALPLAISPGAFADLQLAFVAFDAAPIRVKLLIDELLIVSNDDRQPFKTLYLRGLWQREGEGNKEPTAQEMISVFGFRTKVGFSATDPDKGANHKPKGDEVLTSYFVRADTTLPVTIRQMGAYHGCCTVQPDSISWFRKGNTSSLINATKHLAEDAQRLLPRSLVSATYTPAEAAFYPPGPFGFKVGAFDWSDTLLTPQRRIGIRVWKAVDARGQTIPGAYILANDYLGTSSTNYDYNDNMYFVTNIRPETGPVAVSSMVALPSAVDFGERRLQSDSVFSLTLVSQGQRYANGLADPDISIRGVAVVGENHGEFSASLPAKTVLTSLEGTTLSVAFRPQTEGLKTADLLVFFNTAASPLRVPLHGLGKAEETTVSMPYRVKGGSTTSISVNGRTWASDAPYVFDHQTPFFNPGVMPIGATDDDALYLTQQSSNGDKMPFRYELPLPNGRYWVRLHFAETYWGTPAAGLQGGAGSRVMSVELENRLGLVNLDVAQEAGIAAALVKNIPVTVADGKLSLRFLASAGRPVVSALEVYRFEKAAVIPQPGPPQVSTEKLKLYPNPVSQKLTIEFPAGYGGTIHLQLMDAAGRLWYQGKEEGTATGFTLELPLSNLVLAPGIYFLRILSAAGKTDILKLLIR